MVMHKYKSSVLNCDGCNGGCPVCRFLYDFRDGMMVNRQDMLAVIALLDDKLAQAEARDWARIREILDRPHGRQAKQKKTDDPSTNAQTARAGETG